MKTLTRLLTALAVILLTVGCDQVTKHVATNVLAGAPDRSFLADTVRFIYAENSGAFLSLGANLPDAVRTAVFTVGTGLMLLVLSGFALTSRRGWPQLGLILFVAGGLSNWIDRVARGAVVDFMNVGVGPVRTGIFNVADVAIMLGAIVFVASEVRRSSPAPSAPAEPLAP